MIWLRLLRRVRRHPSLLVGFSALLVLVAVGGRFADRHSRWLNLQGALKAEHWDEATAAADFFEARWPRDPVVVRLAARVARCRGDLPGAESRLNRCLELEGGATADTQLEFLLLRAQTGEVDEVSPALQKLVLENHPDGELILETVARAFMQKVRYAPAQEVLAMWVERYPNSAKPEFWQGWVAEGVNRFAFAKVCYLRAIELDPAFALARKRLAEMFLADLQPSEARKHLTELLRRDPVNPEYAARLGLALFQEGKFDEARERMRAVLSRVPTDATPALTLGRIELQSGNAAAAEPYFRQALKIDTYNSEARFSLATCLADLGHQEEADREFGFRRELDDKVVTANKLLEAEGLKPSNNPAKFCEIGSALLDIGQTTTGLDWLTRALALDPRLAAAHARLAAHYESRGDTALAARHRASGGPAGK